MTPRIRSVTLSCRLAAAAAAAMALPAHADEQALLERGKQLSTTCVACHTPTEAMAAGKGMDDSSPEFLAGGGVFQGWVATSLRGDVGDGLGTWSVEDIIATLKTGRNPHSAVVGEPMQALVASTTQHFPDEDLLALATYLKSLPASGQAPRHELTDDTARALRRGEDVGLGGDLYLDNCAACHRSDGKGDPHAFPALAGNNTVLAENPVSVIRMILGGGAMVATQARPSPLTMPGFAWRLDDEEVAALATFIRSGWGNRAEPVRAEQVKAVRTEMQNTDEERENLTRAAP